MASLMADVVHDYCLPMLSLGAFHAPFPPPIEAKYISRWDGSWSRRFSCWFTILFLMRVNFQGVVFARSRALQLKACLQGGF